MKFRLGLAQTLDQIATAALSGVDLIVFPEDFMASPKLAEPLDGPFVRTTCDAVREHGMWAVFTTFETNPAGGPPFNTAVIVDDTGGIRGTYRKCHLYDAHGVCESERSTAGDELCRPIATPFGTLGVGICYDLRFPEVARQLAVAGCDVILFPAAWHDGPHKRRHWKTLLRARAIENECFVAGVCQAGERYVDQSYVFDPLGNKLASGSGFLKCDIDLGRVAAAREAMPVLAHRRPELYA